MTQLEDRVAGCEERRLDVGWELSLDGHGADPEGWIPARVPGTAAAALRDAGRLTPGLDLDAFECTFRTTFESGTVRPSDEVALALGGVATVADVFLNGEHLLESESMFLAHELDITSLLRDRNELVVRCRPLAPLLEMRRRPRMRWRTRVAPSNLRFFRTMLLGRAPGFAPGPAAVGPWRDVTLRRRRGCVLEDLSLLPRVVGADGVLEVRSRIRAIGCEMPDAVEVAIAGNEVRLPIHDGRVAGSVVVPRVSLWWPSTHGDPVLHEVRVRAADTSLTRRVGFRMLEPGPGYDPDEAPLALKLNGADVFARGVVWTPPDFVALTADQAALRRALERLCDAGMNIVRIPGTGAYESAAFHDLCDELGLLVWQDFMFANFDYPIDDPTFRDLIEREIRQELAVIAGRPSLAVLCGNSEVEQQAAMLGIDPSLARGPLFGDIVPQFAREAGIDAAYVPSAPSGGGLPFRPAQGVANYYGVGGYRRPLDDARRANVGFAAECLAFANVPDDETLEESGLAGSPVAHPRWKEGVPRDAGVGWDFDDVRDWYFAHLFGVDPNQVRQIDPHRYLELSRAVSGEVMAEVFGEWRRQKSPCSGGLVLWLHDLLPGAGWGIVDATGRPKVAYHHLRRVLASVALWTTDEGLGGIDVHVANDRPDPLRGTLRVALYRDFECRIAEGSEDLVIEPRSATMRNVESVIGSFVDASYAYRFGPPGHDVVVASFEGGFTGGVLSQAFRFPNGPPERVETAERLGLRLERTRASDGTVRLRVSSDRLVYGVRVVAAGWIPDDDAFCVEPGHERTIALRAAGSAPLDGYLTALNLAGRIPIPQDT